MHTVHTHTQACMLFTYTQRTVASTWSGDHLWEWRNTEKYIKFVWWIVFEYYCCLSLTIFVMFRPFANEQITADDFFPATVEYQDNREVEFVTAICSSQNIESLEFKLMPTYVIYMAARHNLSRRIHRLSTFPSSVARAVYNIIQVNEITIWFTC